MKRGGREPESVEIVLLPDPAEEPTIPASGRAGPSTGARWLALITAAAVIVAIVIVNRSEDQTTGEAIPLPDTIVSAQASPAPAEQTASLAVPLEVTESVQDWDESIRSAVSEANENAPLTPCADTTAFTQFESAPSTEKTGIKVLVGAGAIVDVDSGGITQPTVDLDPGERIAQALRTGDRTFLLIKPCDIFAGLGRVLLLREGSPPIDVPIAANDDDNFYSLNDIGGSVYGTVLRSDKSVPELIPLMDAPSLKIPRGFEVFFVEGDWLVGVTANDGSASGVIAVYNTVTEEKRELGTISFDKETVTLTANNGRVVWVGPDATDSGGEDFVHIYNVLDESLTSPSRPAPKGFSGTTLSADGSSLAGLMFAGSETSTGVHPYDYAVLELNSGKILTVPNMQNLGILDSESAITFVDGGKRLVITATAPDGLHILTWTPGDADLREVPGTVVEDSHSNYRPVILPAD